MKKFIALIIIFSLISFHVNLIAKERRGATLVVEKKDGQRIKGELIVVKKNSLLLLDSESRTDVSVNIDEIKVLTILKKSKALLGVGIGLLVGGGSGAIIGSRIIPSRVPWPGTSVPYSKLFAFSWGLLGLIIGGIAGATAGTDETIQIEGKPDSEIIEVLEKLKSKARIPDYK